MGFPQPGSQELSPDPWKLRQGPAHCRQHPTSSLRGAGGWDLEGQGRGVLSAGRRAPGQDHPADSRWEDSLWVHLCLYVWIHDVLTQGP